MRKSRLFVVCALIILSFSLGVFADEVAEVFFNVAKVQVNGKMTDAPTILYQGTTFVPVRFVSTELGADVQWDAASKTVIIKNKNSEASKSSWDRKITVEKPQEPEKPQSTFGYPGLNKEPQEPKKDVKTDMEKQLRNIEFNMVSGPIDGKYPILLMTPHNGTGYIIKRMEVSYTFGDPSKLRWQDVNPQSGGVQQRMKLTYYDPSGGLFRVKVIMSDGNEQHEFEYDFTVKNKHE